MTGQQAYRNGNASPWLAVTLRTIHLLTSPVTRNHETIRWMKSLISIVSNKQTTMLRNPNDTVPLLSWKVAFTHCAEPRANNKHKEMTKPIMEPNHMLGCHILQHALMAPDCFPLSTLKPTSLQFIIDSLSFSTFSIAKLLNPIKTVIISPPQSLMQCISIIYIN